MTIKEWPRNEKPREKLLDYGARHLSDAELLALLLQTGQNGSSALDVARHLLKSYHNLKGIFEAAPHDVLQQRGIGPAKYTQLQAALEIARRYLLQSSPRLGTLLDPATTLSFLRAYFAHYQYEVFIGIFLDSRNQIITSVELFSGSMAQVTIQPRVIVKHAILHHASAVIFAHNHPGGYAMPSEADIHLTQQLAKILALIELRVHDHFILGEEGYYSFAEAGIL